MCFCKTNTNCHISLSHWVPWLKLGNKTFPGHHCVCWEKGPVIGSKFMRFCSPPFQKENFCKHRVGCVAVVLYHHGGSRSFPPSPLSVDGRIFKTTLHGLAAGSSSLSVSESDAGTTASRFIRCLFKRSQLLSDSFRPVGLSTVATSPSLPWCVFLVALICLQGVSSLLSVVPEECFSRVLT